MTKLAGPAALLAVVLAVGEAGKAFERYVAWDTIFVSDDKEPGTWRVAVFLDERLLVSGRFEVK